MILDSPGEQRRRPSTGASVRPDGGCQVGVGPGAVVLHRGTTGGAAETAEVLGAALLGAPPVAPGAAGQEPLGACVVRGAGPLASGLRRALADLSPAPCGVVATRGPGRVDVVVHQRVVPPEEGVRAARSGRPTVPVVAQPRRVVVGPVVGTGEGPCLHCLDLHRRDRDPAWPTLAATLGHPVEQVVPVDLPRPLVRAAEGLALLLVSSVLAGRAVSPGLAHEVGPGAPHVVTRRWTAHPACPWHG